MKRKQPKGAVRVEGTGKLTHWPSFNSLLALDLPAPFKPGDLVAFTVTRRARAKKGSKP